MAEEGVWRTRQDRRQTATLGRQVRMAHGIDTAVEPVQAARGYSAGNGACRIAKRTEQLADGHDPVLSICQLSKLHLEVRSSFLPHSGRSGNRSQFSP